MMRKTLIHLGITTLLALALPAATSFTGASACDDWAGLTRSIVISAAHDSQPPDYDEPLHEGSYEEDDDGKGCPSGGCNNDGGCGWNIFCHLWNWWQKCAFHRTCGINVL